MTKSELEAEMARRTSVDGIPRHIVDGKIMKLDWELSSEYLEDDLSGQALEDHIAQMIASQLPPETKM